ncbi:MAG: lysophospholipid acyltransferase family protein [Myxococcota bacterium]
MRRRLRRFWKKQKRWAVYRAALLLSLVLSFLPRRFALWVGETAGAWAYVFAGEMRRRSIEQMSSVLAMRPEEATAKVKRMFTHLGLMVAELVIVSRDARWVEEAVELPEESKACLDRVMAKGTGVVAVSAHFGNWELLPQRVARAGYLVGTVARENPNPYFDRWIVGLRERRGIKTIHRGKTSSPKEILRILRSGGIFALLVDQKTRVRSVRVPFLGRPAETPVGPAELVLKAEIPLIAAFIFRHQGRHRVQIEEISTADLVDGPVEARALALTARINAVIEGVIRRAPEQWVWFHERWEGA